MFSKATRLALKQLRPDSVVGPEKFELSLKGICWLICSLARAVLSFLFVYSLVWLDFFPLAASTREELLPVLPLWAIVSLGSYCLGTLGIGLMTFGDCEPAYRELVGEIQQARDELRSKGVRVD